MKESESPMRMALLSDIHGNYHALQAVLADLETVEAIDMIWNLGDYMAFGAQPAACVQAMLDLQAQYGEDNVKFIGGNTDRYVLAGDRPGGRARKLGSDDDQDTNDDTMPADIAQTMQERDDIFNWTLAQLNTEQYEFVRKIIGRELRTRIDGYGHVYGFHAIPGDDESTALAPDSPDEIAADALLDRQGKLALVGHTHHQMDRTLGHWRVINPGSIGMSFDDATLAQWAILTLEDGEISVEMRQVSYDYDGFVQTLRESDFPHAAFTLGKLNS